jgi:hypothetical protein
MCADSSQAFDRAGSSAALDQSADSSQAFDRAGSSAALDQSAHSSQPFDRADSSPDVRPGRRFVRGDRPDRRDDVRGNRSARVDAAAPPKGLT